MIAYKSSHVKFNFTGTPTAGKFCGTTLDQHSQDKSPDSHMTNDNDDRSRLKRQTTSDALPDRVCNVRLQFTTSFRIQYGRDSDDAVANYLLLLMNRIDTIYDSTVWNRSNITGTAAPGRYGLQVSMIEHETMYDEITCDGQRTSTPSSPCLLEDLSTHESMDTVPSGCLIHLFTGNAFTDGVLGLAYIASRVSGSPGGICSPVFSNFNGRPFFTSNTGVSSFNNNGRLLLIPEAVIVAGHEFGHNWGSFHDPVECTPGGANGNFLMYEFAQDGSRSNNKLFSECSILAITRVLNAKSSSCFEDRSTSMCGNYIVEPEEDEECDVGPNMEDTCCTTTCKFKSNFNCSDVNHACCRDCVAIRAAENFICDMAQAGNENCRGNITCSGERTCPSVAPVAPPDTPCGIGGRCIAGGDCLDACQQVNLTRCFCTGNDECKICCHNGTSCTPLEGGTRNLPEGSFCQGGSCRTMENNEVMCVPSNPELSTFLFSIVNFDVDAIAKLFRENIVGTIIIFSLIVWIPVSLVVHCVLDLKREKEKKRNRKKAGLDETTKLIKSGIDNEDGGSIDENSNEIDFNTEADLEYDPITEHIITKRHY